MRLKTGRGLDLRPTPDRVKEAVFSIIGQRVENSLFLDLFAGTGSLAIEALSRGAARAVMVESCGKSLRLIRANAAAAGFQERTEIVSSDVYSFIRQAAQQSLKFDIIAADPPYLKKSPGNSSRSLAEKTLLEINRNDIVLGDGLVFIEHHSSERIACDGILKPLFTRQYGTTAVSFFEKKNQA